jgi:hypothetical protein
MKRTLAPLFCLFAVLLLPPLAAAVPAGSASPLSVRLVPLVGTDVLPGIPLTKLTVIIRNLTTDKASGVPAPQAIVLRGVEWVEGQPDFRNWRGPVPGSIRQNSDGTLSYNPHGEKFTDYAPEQGLLLPGEEISVSAPFTPQREESLVLRIRYAFAGESSRWAKQVLLPVPTTDGNITFVFATPERVAARHNLGGLGALRATFSPKAPPLAVQTMTSQLELPLSVDPEFAFTGGLSLPDAAQQAGAEESRGPWHGTYSARLNTWFFTSAKGAALALERSPLTRASLPRNAPSGAEPSQASWTPRPMPEMDLVTPETLGRLDEGGTWLMLDPAIFGDIVSIIAFKDGPATDQAETLVPAEKIWLILNRARERQLRLRVTAADPNGLRPDTCLRFTAK